MDKQDIKKDEQKSPKKKRKWTKRFTILGIFIAILLTVLPIGIELGGEKWLHDNGVPGADIGDIDLNLFTGQFAVKNLQIGASEGETFKLGRLYIDLLWQPLTQKRIIINEVAIENAFIDVFQNKEGLWQIGQLVIPQTSETPTTETPPADDQQPLDWHFGLNGLTIHQLTTHFRDTQLDTHIGINTLEIKDIASWSSSQETSLVVDIHVDDSQLQVDTRAVAFAEQPEIKSSIKLNKLNLGNYINFAKAGGVQELGGYLSTDLTLDATVGSDAKIQSTINGLIQLDDLAVATEEQAVKQKLIKWEGQTAVNFPAAEDEQLATLSGALILEDSDIQLLPQQLQIQQKALTWEGETHYSELKTDDDSQPNLAMLATLGIQQLKIIDTKTQTQLLATDAIELQGINVEKTTTAHIEQLVVKNSTFVKTTNKEGKKSGQVGKLGAIIVNNIKTNENQDVDIKSVRLSNLDIAINILKNGDIKHLNALMAANGDSEKTPPVEEATTEESNTNEKPPRITLGEFKLDGKNTIKFKDQSVEPAFEAKLSELKLSAKNLDSGNAKNASPVSMSTNLGEYTSLKLDGNVFAFAEKPTVDIKGKLKSLDLPPLSSYTGKHLGYNLKRGTLDSDISIDIQQGKLNIVNDLKINKLTLTEQDKEKIEGMTQQLSMPLDAALDMLRDGDDNIEFEVAIEGDINDPKFDPSGIINLAMGKALKAAAMGYVKNALQPLGTIMFVGKLLGKAAAPRFEPVKFEIGANEYANKDSVAYMDKITKLLTDRPKLSITVCGIATQLDRAELLKIALQAAEQATTKEGTKETENADTEGASATPEISREQLLDLAKLRGEKVKTYFVKDKGISAERIFSCHPSINDEEDAIAGVDISL